MIPSHSDPDDMSPVLVVQIGSYLAVQSAIEELARRWVTTYEGTFCGYSVNCVKLTYDAKDVGTITFSYRHCDGVQWAGQGSTQLPATYLANSTTLEADARAAKEALYSKHREEQAKADALRLDPAVQRYLEAEGRRGYSMQAHCGYPFTT